MQRKRLINISQDVDMPSIDKLAAYLGSLHSYMRLGYVALNIYSRTLGTQTSLTSCGVSPFTPSPAQSVPTYSVARQMAEIVGEDADDKIMRFSSDSSLPQDLAALVEPGVMSPHISCLCCLLIAVLRKVVTKAPS